MLDARRNLRVAGVGELGLVECAHCIQNVAAVSGGVAFGVVEKQDGFAAAAKLYALVDARQKTRRPQARACPGEGAGLQNDVGGQIGVFGAQAVSDPRAGARPTETAETGVEKKLRGCVVKFVGVDRFHKRELVGHSGEVGQ